MQETGFPSDWSHVTSDLEPPSAPGPLAGFVAGLIVTLVLWLLIGCTAVVLRSLGVG